jgi:hypothetical protein
VIDTFSIGVADPTGDPNIVPGMNLDGFVSDGVDPEGCLHMDFTSPPPDNEPGVDNQLGPIFAAVGSSLDFDFRSAIASGEWLILLSLEDGPAGRVISLYRGTTLDGERPLLDGGRLAPGQPFRVRERLGQLVPEPGGARTRAGPENIVFPFSPRSTSSIRFPHARLYGNFRPDGVRQGVLGGAYLVDQAVDELVALDPDVIPRALARSVLQAQADLDPTPSGECATVSAAYTFTAVPAVLEP